MADQFTKESLVMLIKKSFLVVLYILLLGYSDNAYPAKTENTLKDSTTKSIIIKGTITNTPPDSFNLIHLYSYYGEELSRIGTAYVNVQGNFKFELSDTIQQGLYKIGVDKENSASIVLSGEKDIIIRADYEQLKADKIVVDNSKENEAYRKLLSEWIYCTPLSKHV